ncbi:response regulator [Nesterenkonia halophila]|uniref:response regulator n=1 Tax=Nesterenkonia halophila TaxID=302044 RepID=UPI001291F785|nr:response regulator [Nesterenkonia halophila]
MIRVLIVDDDARVAQNHRELVDSTAGFEVVDVEHTAASAVAAVQRHAPDLVLLDLFLPDRPGLDVLREMRGPGQATGAGLVDVVVITALRELAHVRTALQSGALHYLLKPFPLATLREVLERYAAMRRTADRLSTVTQGDVDQLISLLRPTPSAALPKGLTATTATLVAETLRGAAGDLSAAEVSEATGIARVTARRYLEHLCTEKRAELRLQYGSAGRPEHRYRWAN